MIFPKNERARIEALRRYQILDTPPDGAFDRITELVSQLLDVPIVVVSLVDTDRIWFKSRFGLNFPELERVPGLCASAILGNDPYILNDTRLDPRALTNPLVTGEFGLRFYASVPLQTYDNFNLGTLACLDFNPRVLTDRQIKILNNFAQIVMDQMELRLAARRVDEMHQSLLKMHDALLVHASHDSLTGIWNRSAIIELLENIVNRSRREEQQFSIMILDVDFFKRINDTYGHPTGDKVLITIVQRLQLVFRDSDVFGRLGGEEFLGVMYPCDTAQAKLIAERCLLVVSEQPMHIGEEAINMSVSGGIFCSEHRHNLSVQECLKKADQALYLAKHNGRNQVIVSQ